MKKQLLVAMLYLYASMASAQLEVDTNGNVGIKATPTTSYALRLVDGSNTTGTISVNRDPCSVPNTGQQWSMGIFSRAAHTREFYSFGVRGHATSSAYNVSIGAGRCFGVYGQGYGATEGYNYGVYGCIGQQAGSAIYGSVNDHLGIALDQRYAGFFNGPVKVMGNLNVTGNISGVLLGAAPGISQSSVGDLSQNAAFRSDAAVSSQLTTLDVNTFYHAMPRTTMKKDSDISATGDTLEAEITLTRMEEQVLSKQHYALDAEQLEAIFPDLVYDNEDGTKSINYVEMVPILVQAIKELKSEIKELKGEGVVKTREPAATDVASIKAPSETITLGQNVPNPFSMSTAITVNVPTDVVNACLNIYDFNGRNVDSVVIVPRGLQTISLQAASLAEGIYLYSLVADGKVIQTRRMIVE